MKLVKISEKAHRAVAIHAAREGVTITSVVERAVREELAKLKETRRRKRNPSSAVEQPIQTGA